MSLRSVYALVVAGGIGLLATAASAAVVVNNGNFQTGNLTGWTTDGVTTIEANAGPGGAGDYAAHWNGGGWHYGGFHEDYNNGTQVITPQPSTAYTISFDMKAAPGSTGNLYFLLDSYYEAPEVGYPSWTISTDSGILADHAWHTMTFDFTSRATWQNFGMAFQVPGTPGAPNVYLDNFQVNPVPEPASMAVLGLASLTVLRRRRSA